MTAQTKGIEPMLADTISFIFAIGLPFGALVYPAIADYLDNRD